MIHLKPLALLHCPSKLQDLHAYIYDIICNMHVLSSNEPTLYVHACI